MVGSPQIAGHRPRTRYLRQSPQGSIPPDHKVLAAFLGTMRMFRVHLPVHRGLHTNNDRYEISQICSDTSIYLADPKFKREVRDSCGPRSQRNYVI
ncbi:hypothetical protein HYPSUDRAFT_730567 [Hypholoma sublateritium FD-334 SS-4]|uniref:Uncharacterized protein n=1 Tax=Hypholoma sublateritium (strain FD-334 SS-4) TaxID=945553 RepID=A0A0D2L3N3_HYPSF|nr:hypothetical protein HYPSUDRAFT_730567 [Hypholoma sublateritium FD-334 SS-4]